MLSQILSHTRVHENRGVGTTCIPKIFYWYSTYISCLKLEIDLIQERNWELIYI